MPLCPSLPCQPRLSVIKYTLLLNLEYFKIIHATHNVLKICLLLMCVDCEMKKPKQYTMLDTYCHLTLALL